MTDTILRTGAPERIACPVLLCTAELDKTVMPEQQKQFIQRVPKGQHEIVKEQSTRFTGPRTAYSFRGGVPSCGFMTRALE